MRRVLYLAVLAATLVPAATASAESPAEKQLAQQVGAYLKQSGKLHNYRVGVRFHDGVAYLNGSVSSPEQRDLAVKLAQQVDGVSHVVCKLDCPVESETAASSAAARNAGDRREANQPLSRTSYEEGDSSEVTHAYESGESQGAAMQQNQQMAQRQMIRPAAPQGRRSNMPVPAGRMAGPMPMGPGNPSGVQQASCPTCNGGGMPPGMGAGMMGPGCQGGMGGGEPAPMGFVPGGGAGRGPSYDNPQMPGYAWPSYASYPNYAALQYPQQYSPTAWPYIGPFYPYPQVPLAWRKVSLEWDDGWWFLDFSSHNSSH